MPLYEFRCGDCGKDFEDLVPSGTQQWPCPACGSRQVTRLASAAAFSVGGRMSTTGSGGCAGCSSGNCGSCGSGGGHGGGGGCGCGGSCGH